MDFELTSEEIRVYSVALIIFLIMIVGVWFTTRWVK